MTSPILELLRERSERVTLDMWLEASGVSDVDGEIEVPEEFEDEYRERCRWDAELERKWAATLRAARRGDALA